ncbi:MAG TPA: bifunctional diaminohydroxyphosphoribosylaminopyrimidine deaminase/5-amino-6-(5-phosphoribosylamino)uracil reductase RibD [Gemmatimonadales bacterium]|nr:bifunctional diaminohydroxyphosphoribosylaminopyrimidine deaminase/5-amino-6-(5-phosphoribosylamino)uracil reductase RibD [Gemmatimonadales bacterium]
MSRALDLALSGWGRVAPNPLVGAVILQDGQPLAEGWHAEFGGPHAEVVALKAAGHRARGSTLVVNLEPCKHQGKTPPCVDAILEAGVRRVVAATRDPDREAGGGLERLRQAGVDVDLGMQAAAAASLNAAFLHARLEKKRPFVALKLATSVDGRIADHAGRSQWVSGEAARDYVHWLRAGYDAIAVGGTTALRDNPRLTVRGAVTPRKPPVRVVFDRRAMLNPTVSLVQTAREIPTWVMASPDAPANNASVLDANGVRVFRPFDLPAGLEELRGAGIQSVLCEGGGALGAKLLSLGLVDRLYWIQAPFWLGNGGVPAFPDVLDVDIDQAPRWIPVERKALGADTLLVLDRRLCLPE